jgi:hypothetical protein
MCYRQVELICASNEEIFERQGATDIWKTGSNHFLLLEDWIMDFMAKVLAHLEDHTEHAKHGYHSMDTESK